MTAQKMPEAIKVYMELRSIQTYNPEPDCRPDSPFRRSRTMLVRGAFASCLKKADGVKGMELLVKLATAALEKLGPSQKVRPPKKRNSSALAPHSLLVQ